MKKLALSIVASACLLLGLAAVNAQPASATIVCSGQQTNIMKPVHIGGGQWLTEIRCGSITPTSSRTQLGVGVNTTNIQLCQTVLGACSGGGYWYCITANDGIQCSGYMPGGLQVRGRVQVNGGGSVYSPTANT